jgi:hypothetical protein
MASPVPGAAGQSGSFLLAWARTVTGWLPGWRLETDWAGLAL